jgi:hypothetical protein
METKETRNDEKTAKENWPDMPCCASDGNAGEMAGGCKSFFETCDCSAMMGEWATTCRWFPLLPAILGIALLLLGYYLDPTITRVLWMLAAGFVALLGILGLILAGSTKNMCCGTR